MNFFSPHSTNFHDGLVLSPQPIEALLYHGLRCACPGRHEDRVDVMEPLIGDVAWPIDQMSRTVVFLGQFSQTLAVGAVLAAHDQHQVGLWGQQVDGFLTILGRVADVFARRALNIRKPVTQSIDDTIRIVDRQGCLSEIGQLLFIVDLQAVDVIDIFDEDNGMRCLTHRPNHFVVAFMSN